MATKSYKKKSIVAGSPAIQEHEAMMQEVMNEQPVNDTPAAPTASVPTGKGVKPTGVFSQYATGMTKNVQTRIPFDMYQRLLALEVTPSYPLLKGYAGNHRFWRVTEFDP